MVPDEDKQLLVRLHPADEEVRVSLHGERILLSARTNGGGPGYHAFVVSLMDEVAAAHKLRWLPEVTEGDAVFNDETGYFADRRADVLKDSMAAWLVAVARHLSDAAVDGNLYLMSMPMGTPVPCGLAGVVTPMGCVSLSWLRETADPEATEADVRARAAGFFPWWEAAVDEHARVGVGRSALWRFPWHPPQGRRGDRAGERGARLPRSDTVVASAPAAPSHTATSRKAGDLWTVTPAAAPRGRHPPTASDSCGEPGDGMPFPGLHAGAPRATSTSRTTRTDRAKVYWSATASFVSDSWLVTSSEAGRPHATRARRAQHGVGAGATRGRRARSPSKRLP